MQTNNVQSIAPSRTIELPLSRGYVRAWGVRQAVRELLQNAIDSDSPLEYSFNGDTLTIGSRDVVLDTKSLILGNTTKAEDMESIGNFGEGYKLALLVLIREGLKVVVRNGYVDWHPEFRQSDVYQDEVLCINEVPAAKANFALEFVISGLSHEQTTEIYDSCLQMQPPQADAIETDMGNILPSKPGCLYVGGLFVCHTDLTYGYDMKPKYLQLERDRMTVSNWDLRLQVKNMWFATQRWDEIAEKMDQKVTDLDYAEYGCPELVKEACFRRFKAQHPGHIAVKSQAELDAAVQRGMTKTVYVGGSYHTGVTGSRLYQEEMAQAIKVLSPLEVLTEWLEKNQRILSQPARLSFKALLSAAQSWSNK